MSKREQRRSGSNIVSNIPADNRGRSPLFDVELSAADQWANSSERSELPADIMDNAYGKSEPAAAELEHRIAQLEQHVNKFKVGKLGVEVVGDASEDDIKDKLREVASIEKAVFWAYGDLLIYAIDSGWSNVYAWASKELGKTISTLENYVMVARSFSGSERSEQLGYKAHEILTRVPDQKVRRLLMQRAIDEKLSTRALQAIVDQKPLPEKIPAYRQPVRRIIDHYKDRWESMTSEERDAVYSELYGLIEWMESAHKDDN